MRKIFVVLGLVLTTGSISACDGVNWYADLGQSASEVQSATTAQCKENSPKTKGRVVNALLNYTTIWRNAHYTPDGKEALTGSLTPAELAGGMSAKCEAVAKTVEEINRHTDVGATTPRTPSK